MPLAAVAFGLVTATPALAIDWNAVTGKEVVLFYPGQASFEWALTQSDHSGAKKFREGKKCKECHDGEQADIGKKVVSGKKLEPAPIAGKRGSIPVTVKTAHDAENLYVRLEWPDAPPPSAPPMDPEFEVKATFMLDDGTIAAATRAGCWATCHDDAIGMASAPPDKRITKYLVRSRTKVTRHGGGENYKPSDVLDKMLQGGEYMEFWQARLNKGAAAVASDGYVLEKRYQSDSPVATAEAEFANDRWSVVLSRKLAGAGPHHKDIVAGKTYTVGFAIHDAHAEHRFHHVSFEYSLVLDQGEADFVAAKQ
jgi:hypothetical protein